MLIIGPFNKFTYRLSFFLPVAAHHQSSSIIILTNSLFLLSRQPSASCSNNRGSSSSGIVVEEEVDMMLFEVEQSIVCWPLLSLGKETLLLIHDDVLPVYCVLVEKDMMMMHYDNDDNYTVTYNFSYSIISQ